MSSSALPPTSINHAAASKASRSTYATQAEWVHVKFAETAAFKDVYGFAGNQGMVNLEGIRWLPKDRPSKTLLVYMHPASNLQLLPMPRAMAEMALALPGAKLQGYSVVPRKLQLEGSPWWLRSTAARTSSPYTFT